MALITINVTDASSTGTTWTSGDYERITIGGKTLKELGASDSTTSTITVPSYGTFTLTAAKEVTFTADAALAAGTYAFTTGSNANVTIADMSAMTGAFTLDRETANAKLLKLTTGSGADVVDATKYTALTDIVTNAGQDTVTFTADDTAVTLISTGADADVINGTVSAANAATFTLNAGDGDDTVSLAGSATMTLDKTVVLGAGNDAVTVGANLTSTVYGNAGDDTMTASDATAAATFNGGAGADKFVQGDAAAVMNVSDYDYSQGDTIKLASNFGTVKMKSNGTFVDSTGSAKVTATVAAAGGVLKVKATGSSAIEGTVDFWTAQDAVDAVTMDASALTNGYYLDASAATTADIKVGTAAGLGGHIMLAAGANNVTVGKAGGSVEIASTNAFGEDDVLNLAGGLTAAADGSIVSAGTTVRGVAADNATKIVTYTENGSTAAKKTIGIVGASSEANIGLTSTTGTLDKYINMTTGEIGADSGIDASALTTAQSFRLNNDEGTSDKYTNIYYVKGGAAGGTFVGANDGAGATTFDLGTATVGSQIWSGGTKNALTLALHDDSTDKKAAADTIWMGTTEQTNTVTKFSKGFADTSDIIYLYETADVNNADLYTGVTGGNAVAVKAGKTATGTVALSDVNVLAASGVQLKVKDASGTVRNVAYGSTDATGIQAVDQTAGTTVADYVIGKAAGTEVDYTSTVTGQSYNVRLNNDAMATTKFTSVSKVDMTGVADDAKMTVVGSNSTGEGANVFTLDGAQTDFWGGGSQADSVTLSSVEKATNTVWYGKTDGWDTVNKVDGTGQTNTAYFYDETSLATLVKDYTTIVDTKAHTVTFIYDTDNKLTWKGDAAVSSLYVKTQAGSTKAAVATVTNAANSLTFAADTNLYLGNGVLGASGTKISVSGTSGATVRLNNDDGTNYYRGMAGVDASGVTAGNVVLVGSGEAAVGSTLTGGYGTQNDYWGGSKAADEINGKAGITDVIWFDSGDGADKAYTFGTEDKVYLYNTASIDSVKVTGDTADLTITVSDGDTLMIEGGVTNEVYGSSGITVGLNNGSNYYVNKATDGTYSLAKRS